MIPGWTHDIINLSETENQVTVMTCNRSLQSEPPGHTSSSRCKEEEYWLSIGDFYGTQFLNGKTMGAPRSLIGCGTRPEIIRLAAVIKRCREYFDCCVVYYSRTGTEIFLPFSGRDFELKNTFGGMARTFCVPVVGENLGVPAATFWVAAMSYSANCSRRVIWC